MIRGRLLKTDYLCDGFAANEHLLVREADVDDEVADFRPMLETEAHRACFLQLPCDQHMWPAEKVPVDAELNTLVRPTGDLYKTYDCEDQKYAYQNPSNARGSQVGQSVPPKPFQRLLHFGF